MSDAPVFQATYAVSFGDCDPAGIVFYPNIFAWLDRTFHGYLKAAGGGHAAICAALNALGTGLIGADCKFRKPVREGDELTIEMTQIDWAERSFTVIYQGLVGDDIVFNGEETRAVFVKSDGRIRAGEVSTLQALLKEKSNG